MLGIVCGQRVLCWQLGCKQTLKCHWAAGGISSRHGGFHSNWTSVNFQSTSNLNERNQNARIIVAIPTEIPSDISTGEGLQHKECSLLHVVRATDLTLAGAALHACHCHSLAEKAVACG